MLALRESAWASAVDTALVFHGPAAAAASRRRHLNIYLHNTKNSVLRSAPLRFAIALSTTPQYYPGPSKTADTVRENRAS